jgi:MFS superfamily sulfate permease-like transporter
MGTFSIFFLMGLKYACGVYPKLKWVKAAGPLMLTVIAVILTVSCNLVDKGIPVVGHIPSGFPNFTASQWTPIVDFGKLVAVVFSIAVVGFMEWVAIAKQLASKNKYAIASSKELVGLGMANLLGGAFNFNAYPVAGSFSRSAVNNEAGAVLASPGWSLLHWCALHCSA